MPTGYTYKIENGEINTGVEFLKLCTRAFGIAVDMRDESLSVPTPSYFEPDRHYYEEYQKKIKEKDKYQNMNFDDVKQNMIDSHNRVRSEALSILSKYKAEDEKYKRILKEVEAWYPPTPAHENLKKFAMEQIQMSMNTSIIQFYEDKLTEELDISNEAVYKTMEELKESYEKDCQRAWDKWQREVDRAKERTEWMQQLLKSLEENHGMD